MRMTFLRFTNWKADLIGGILIVVTTFCFSLQTVEAQSTKFVQSPKPKGLDEVTVLVCQTEKVIYEKKGFSYTKDEKEIVNCAEGSYIELARLWCGDPDTFEITPEAGWKISQLYFSLSGTKDGPDNERTSTAITIDRTTGKMHKTMRWAYTNSDALQEWVASGDCSKKVVQRKF